MHEFSVARSLLHSASRICREQGFVRPVEVTVQIGPLSGVESLLLQSAFEQQAAVHAAVPARLVIEQTPLVIRCLDCETESNLPDYDFRCRACDSRAVRVIGGDQLLLVSVTAEGDDDRPEGAP
jgi:hydrogenase nickel incorporation protein HypA/HybF